MTTILPRGIQLYFQMTNYAKEISQTLLDDQNVLFPRLRLLEKKQEALMGI